MWNPISFFCIRILRGGIAMCFALLACSVASRSSSAQESNQSNLGDYCLRLETLGGPLEVGLTLYASDNGTRGKLVNGSEEIVVKVHDRGQQIQLDFPHYDSRVTLSKSNEGFRGTWSKQRAENETATMRATLLKQAPRVKDDPSPFLGRFAVQFKDSPDPAVAVFKRFREKEVIGTFLTTTGDYRYLHGWVAGEQLHLSCFDGAHAFLFTAALGSPGQLQGKFYSGNWYQDSWVAMRDDSAELPDAFQQTSVVNGGKLSDLRFPDASGQWYSLGDPGLRGRVTLVEVFGTWCPNCHDEAAYLKALREKYRERGLRIVGLAFELSGNAERDARQVKRYAKRFQVDYPILIAGLSDKAKASRQFPIVDRIRSYPTTLFLDQQGEIRAVYTGFSGPATGEAHQRLRRSFEALIERLLNE